MTVKQMLTLIKTENGFIVFVPYDYKHEFKMRYPKSKWNNDLKCWELGKRTTQASFDKWLNKAHDNVKEAQETKQQIDNMKLEIQDSFKNKLTKLNILEFVNLGKEWRGGNEHHFYISDDLLVFCSEVLGFSSNFSYSNLYIDVNTKEYKVKGKVKDSELENFSTLIDTLFILLKENLNKTFKSAWTGNISKCENIHHFFDKYDKDTMLEKRYIELLNK